MLYSLSGELYASVMQVLSLVVNELLVNVMLL